MVGFIVRSETSLATVESDQFPELGKHIKILPEQIVSAQDQGSRAHFLHNTFEVAIQLEDKDGIPQFYLIKI